jgi:hypothetical protein
MEKGFLERKTAVGIENVHECGVARILALKLFKAKLIRINLGEKPPGKIEAQWLLLKKMRSILI